MINRWILAAVGLGCVCAWVGCDGGGTSELEPAQDAAVDATCEYNDYYPEYVCMGPKYVCGYVSYCCCLPQTSPIDHVSCSHCYSGMTQNEECNAAYPDCCQGACKKNSG